MSLVTTWPYTLTNGQTADANQVMANFNALSNAGFSLTQSGQTVTGNNTFSGGNTFSGTNSFAGNNTLTGNNTFSGQNNFTVPNTLNSVDSIAALRAVAVPLGNPIYTVRGYTTPGDGSGGQFYWNATSTVADNGVTIIAPTGVVTGRWYKAYIPSPALTIQSTPVWDNFDRPNGILLGMIAPTGQTWFTTGVGGTTATITNGQLSSPGGNVYCALPYGQSVDRLSGSFIFNQSTVPTLPQSGLTLIADNGNATLNNILHMTITSQGWQLDKRVAAGAFVPMPLQTQAPTYNLLVDGITEYQMSMEIDYIANVVTIIDPLGNRIKTVADPDVSTINPQYGVIQIFDVPGTSDGSAVWTGMTLGTSRGKTLTALQQSTPLTELGNLRGAAGTVRNRTVINYPASAAGWYTIATLSGGFMYGTVNLSSGNNSVIYSQAEVLVSGAWNGFPSIPEAALRQLNYSGIYGTPFTQIRVSINSSTAAAQLDVYIADTNVGQLVAELFGNFNPVVGSTNTATVLPTANAILAFSNSSLPILLTTPVSGTIYQNTNAVTEHLDIQVTFNPTAGAAATCAVQLQNYSIPGSIYTITIPLGVAFDGLSMPVHLDVPSAWYYSLVVTNAAINSIYCVLDPVKG